MNCKILLLSSFVLCLANCFTDYKSLNRNEDYLDLSHINWEEHLPIDLSGSWEFYWMELVSPEAFQESYHKPLIPGLVDVPFRPWNSIDFQGNHLSPTGYGTYRIKVKIQNSNSAKKFSIFYPHVFSASKLFINGTLLHENGIISSNIEDIKPIRVNSLEEVLVNENYLDIVLQIANKDFFRGGPRGHFLISSPERMQFFIIKNIMIEVFSFGLIFGAFIYHLAFYFLNPKQKVFLYFSFLCLTFLVRIPFLNSKLYLYYFQVMDFEIFTNFMHYLGIISLLCANAFLNHLFRGKKVNYINQIFYVGACLGLLSPILPGFFKFYFNLIYLVFFLFLFFLHSVILLYLHRDEKRSHFLMGIGLFGLSVFCFLAIFLNFFGIQSGIYLLMGFVIYIIFQSISLSKYFSYAIENRASIEMQLQEENQAALTKQRAEMQLMVHDNLGAGLTDLKVVIDRKIREEDGSQSYFLKELRSRVNSIIQSLRNHLLQIEDLNLTYENFITGLNITLLRRYSDVGRELEFKISDSAINQFQYIQINAKNREYFQNLYFMLYEICTNDIKYGCGESSWTLDIRNGLLLIHQRNFIKDNWESNPYNLKSLTTRIESLRGKIINTVVGNQFELKLEISWVAY